MAFDIFVWSESFHINYFWCFLLYTIYLPIKAARPHEGFLNKTEKKKKEKKAIPTDTLFYTDTLCVFLRKVRNKGFNVLQHCWAHSFTYTIMRLTLDVDVLAQFKPQEWDSQWALVVVQNRLYGVILILLFCNLPQQSIQIWWNYLNSQHKFDENPQWGTKSSFFICW